MNESVYEREFEGARVNATYALDCAGVGCVDCGCVDVWLCEPLLHAVALFQNVESEHTFVFYVPAVFCTVVGPHSEDHVIPLAQRGLTPRVFDYLFTQIAREKRKVMPRNGIFLIDCGSKVDPEYGANGTSQFILVLPSDHRPETVCNIPSSTRIWKYTTTRSMTCSIPHNCRCAFTRTPSEEFM